MNIFSFFFLETTYFNVAAGKPGKVSSNHEDAPILSHFSRLTDIRIGPLFHSVASNINPWALVDLLASYQVKSIGMIHREHCCMISLIIKIISNLFI